MSSSVSSVPSRHGVPARPVLPAGPVAPAVPSPPGPPPGGVVAVLTAAGSGRRLGSEGPKALVAVGGVALVARAAQGLVDSEVVDHVVVTAPPGDVSRFRAELAGQTGLAGLAGLEVVAGSPASRQASVLRGLEAALASVPHAQVVLVHDAARALTPPEVTRRVVAAVRAGHDAVVPALPVTDTVKEVGPVSEAAVTAGAGAGSSRPVGSGAPFSPAAAEAGAEGRPGGGPLVEPVVATPERSRLRAVQTPQGFATATLVAAHRAGAARAGDESVAASDDAGLVESQGGQVVVVAGHERALKITTPLDLALAEVLVGQGPALALVPTTGAAG